MKPVVAALALAMAAGSAYAAPTPNQMPGGGTITAVSFGSAGTSQGGVGTSLVNLVSGGGLGIDGKVVIRWGVGGLGETLNPLGFNLGSNATMYFGAISAGSAVLNIDVSGNPSQIYGNLISTAGAIGPVAPLVGCGACAFAPAIWVSNANGIYVGEGARIVAPSGVGLIGANMDNATSINDFVGNNTWIPVLEGGGGPAYGTSFASYNSISSKGNVTIAGAINGDLVLNKEAAYIIVAGNNIDVLNLGNLYGKTVELNAGVYATATGARVNGVSNVSVNRIFDVDTGVETACCYVGPLAGDLTLSGAGVTGNVTNEGSVSANGTGLGEWITIQAKGNVRSGILGSADTSIGLFSDQGIYIDSYSNSSTVELYSAISGYTTNKTLPFLLVNTYAAGSGFRPDVTLNAITLGAQPSSVTTTGDVVIVGDTVTIDSTINHTGVVNTTDLYIDGNMVSINASIGAGDSVTVYANGPLSFKAGTTAVADLDGAGAGGITVINSMDDAPSTFAGLMGVPSTSGDDIYISTNGPTTFADTSSVLNFGSTSSIYVYNNRNGAPTTFAGLIGLDADSGYNIYIETNGATTFASTSDTINVNGSIQAYNYGTLAGAHTTVDGDMGAGVNIDIWNGLSPANKPLNVGGSLLALNNVYLYNGGASGGNTTTISGDVTAGNNIYLTHVGPPSGVLTLTGSLAAGDTAYVWSDGHAQLGMIDAGNDIWVDVYGTTFGINDAWTAGDEIGVYSPLAQAKFKPAGVLTADYVTLEGLTFRGVNAAGNTYVDASEKPAAQIVTNDLTVMLTGSINGPIAGNTNWPLNSMDIAPRYTLSPVYVSVTANGGGFQAVNLHVLGDAIVDSGATTTPFIGVPLTTGGLPAGGIQGNLGSQLILQADGSMQIWGTPTFTLFGPPTAFQWPGGAAFIAGTTLQTFTPVYNAWSTNSPPFGGVFFEAPYIAMGSFVATSGTAWANFSTMPVTGDPTVFQIRQLTPTSFGFAATTAFVENAYTNTVTGGAVCIITGPTTWTACP